MPASAVDQPARGRRALSETKGRPCWVNPPQQRLHWHMHMGICFCFFFICAFSCMFFFFFVFFFVFFCFFFSSSCWPAWSVWANC